MPSARNRGIGASLCVAVLVLAALTAVAVAHPPAPVDSGGEPLGGKWHTWLHKAKVPLVDGRLRLKFAPCPNHPQFAACVFSKTPRTIYLKKGLKQPRRVYYHELGHVFDFVVLNRRERREFKSIVGLKGYSWYRSSPSPAEWFADAYALCALKGKKRGRQPRRTNYGYLPSKSQHANACKLIETAADEGGAKPSPPPNPPPDVVDQPPPPPAPPSPPPGETCTILEQLLGCKD